MRAPTENQSGSPVTKTTARFPRNPVIVSIIALNGEGQAMRSALMLSANL